VPFTPADEDERTRSRRTIRRAHTRGHTPSFTQLSQNGARKKDSSLRLLPVQPALTLYLLLFLKVFLLFPSFLLLSHSLSILDLVWFGFFSSSSSFSDDLSFLFFLSYFVFAGLHSFLPEALALEHDLFFR
jgi:hypothetical protein